MIEVENLMNKRWKSYSGIEPVIKMSHENISVKFQKLQICPSCSVCVYSFLPCLAREFSVSKSVCCIQSCIFKIKKKNSKNQNKFEIGGKSEIKIYNRNVRVTHSYNRLYSGRVNLLLELKIGSGDGKYPT